MKLNLGSGNRERIPGFTNIDIYPYPNVDHVRDVSDLSIFKDDSVELIYASHVLEYFDLEDVDKVLREWYRVLEPGGILRVAVPDFRELVLLYRITGDISKVLGPIYGKMKAGKKIIYHKTAYDFDTLRAALLINGFRNIKRYNWQETIHKDYDDHSQSYYPHMDKINGLLISLNVEAVK